MNFDYCPVEASLAYHLREQDRADSLESFVERVVVDNEKAATARLIRGKGWICEVIGECGDELADLALAIEHAYNGDDLAAGAMLRRAFVKTTEEKARKLLAEAAEEYAECTDPDAYHCEPDADSIDYSKYE